MYEDNWIDYLEPLVEPPFWTRWRITYAFIAIIVIITLLAMLLGPTLIAITQPAPPAIAIPTTPLPRV